MYEMKKGVLHEGMKTVTLDFSKFVMSEIWDLEEKVENWELRI